MKELVIATVLLVTASAAVSQEVAAPTTTTMIQVTPSPVDEGVRSKVSRVKADMRTLAVGLESYYVDNNGYPPASTKPETSVNRQATEDHPTFAWLPGVAQLTTPIAYLAQKFYADPFADKPDKPFGYYTVEKKKDKETISGWILFSVGPDGKSNESWKLYDPAKPQPSPELLLLEFDPTNGTVSAGDITRVRQ